MCQAPVGKVVSVDGDTITVDYKGKRRVLNSKLVKASIGDYVLFSVNIAIEKVDEQEAKVIMGQMK